MTRGEMLNRRSLAKSLVAAREIPAGTALTREMIASKSPGLGVSPQHIDALIGRTTTRSLAPDDPFVPADLRDAAKRSRAPSRVDVGVPWGVVVRYGDFPALTARFGPLGMGFVEFHLSDKDADARITKLPGAPFPFGLVVHAPEYRGDLLPDLCAEDESERAAAVASAQRAVDAARELGTQFSFESSVFPRGPKVVVHAGGMSKPGAPYETATAISRLRAAARRIDASGVELLIENLPPQPWYFGGRWDGHVMCDVESVVQACTQTGLGLCFDTSHAALACAASGASLSEFADRVKPFVRHLHVADGAGMSGEGLQIGDGVVNFVDILPRLTLPGVTLVPEIWMGHHETGEGFEVALHRLTELHWAREVIGRTPDPETRATLAMLTVSDTATTFGTLRVIDANRMGIAFVIDAAGKVVGVATDGDIRHAFVRGLGLHSPIVDVMNRDFVFGTPELTRAQIRSRLPGRTRVMPILDHEGRLVDVANLWTVGDATP
jgi:sugar phosphate isomerase/epimerase/CBS domain-containing protein